MLYINKYHDLRTKKASPLMCGGLSFNTKDPKDGQVKPKKVYFPIPHAQIPIITPDGIQMTQWGRRKGEDEDFKVPQTGWARLTSLVGGEWNKYSPSRVRIPALSWMEKDTNKESHWFDMAPDTYLLGVKIDKKIDRENRSFVYIVTKDATEGFKHIHEREPFVVFGQK